MKIVIDARESGTSTGRYIDKLIENLSELKSKPEFCIITKKHRVEAIRNTAPGFEVVESNYKEFTFSEQFRFVWQLYGIKTDLVHFGMTHQPVLYFGEAVTTVHDLTTARFRNPSKNILIYKFKQIVYWLVIKWVSRKSVRIIVPSEYVKKDLAGFANISPNKITVTYEAADKITDPAEPLISLLDQKFIMYIGRSLPHKNLERLVEAYALLNEKHPNLKLVLAGKKDVIFNKLERRLQKEGMAGVVFTDFVTDGQLRWLYENCQAYVFPSLSEGFGLPGLEAMVHGAPVVSSNATCLPEIYGEAAHYFEPTDVNDVANKIGQVLDDKKLRDKLILAGKKQAAKYSWKKMAEQTLEVYRQATK